MTRLVAVVAALTLAACGGSETATSQTYRSTVYVCGDQPCVSLGRCINIQPDPVNQASIGGVTCRQGGSQPFPTWNHQPTDTTTCSPADCREVQVNPPAATCYAVVECSRPL